MREFLKSIAEHQLVLGKLGAVLESQLDPAVTMLQEALLEDKQILLCGNGGSAAQASAFAGQLVVRFFKDRKAYPAICLSAEAVIATGAGEAYGFERVFSRQVEAYGRSGDVLVAFSTTGVTKNVLEGIGRAKLCGMRTLGISGARQLNCDVDIAVPSVDAARIHECTLLIVNLIVEQLEERLPP